MPYSCSLECLFAVLEKKEPDRISWLRGRHRRVIGGLLPIGLKLHIRASAYSYFTALARALNGSPDPSTFDETLYMRNVYRLDDAAVCLVLPPVGSAKAAIQLVECLAKYIETPIWGNPDIQVQICTPGRLDAQRSAMLGITFYLASDTLRSYSPEMFKTTVQFDDRYLRSPRLVIYDGYGTAGDFDPHFEYWAEWVGQSPVRLGKLPFPKERSDVIAGNAYRVDIENVNLVSTLLVHAQFGGFWQELGHQFENDVVELLAEHGLQQILAAPWVSRGRDEDMVRSSAEFSEALRELVAFAWEEYDRLTSSGPAEPGLLFAIQDLLSGYRQVMQSTANLYSQQKET